MISGKALKAVRLLHNLKLHELAAKIDYSISYICALENENRAINDKFIKLLCKGLRVKETSLIKFSDNLKQKEFFTPKQYRQIIIKFITEN